MPEKSAGAVYQSIGDSLCFCDHHIPFDGACIHRNDVFTFETRAHKNHITERRKILRGLDYRLASIEQPIITEAGLSDSHPHIIQYQSAALDNQHLLVSEWGWEEMMAQLYAFHAISSKTVWLGCMINCIDAFCALESR